MRSMLQEVNCNLHHAAEDKPVCRLVEVQLDHGSQRSGFVNKLNYQAWSSSEEDKFDFVEGMTVRVVDSFAQVEGTSDYVVGRLVVRESTSGGRVVNSSVL